MEAWAAVESMEASFRRISICDSMLPLVWPFSLARALKLRRLEERCLSEPFLPFIWVARVGRVNEWFLYSPAWLASLDSAQG